MKRTKKLPKNKVAKIIASFLTFPGITLLISLGYLVRSVVADTQIESRWACLWAFLLLIIHQLYTISEKLNKK